MTPEGAHRSEQERAKRDGQSDSRRDVQCSLASAALDGEVHPEYGEAEQPRGQAPCFRAAPWQRLRQPRRYDADNEIRDTGEQDCPSSDLSHARRCE